VRAAESSTAVLLAGLPAQPRNFRKPLSLFCISEKGDYAYSQYAMIAWTVETLDSRVDAELNALPADMRDRFVRIARLLEEFGPQHVREPYVKPLVGKLWEMRMKGKDGIARAVYLAASGRRLVVVHAFIKKTPTSAIDTATRRVKEAGLI